MSNPGKLLAKVIASPNNVRFADMQGLVEAFGFRFHRMSGSHYLYAHVGIKELVNLQERDGKAKAYQVRQFLKLVEEYNLALGD